MKRNSKRSEMKVNYESGRYAKKEKIEKKQWRHNESTDKSGKTNRLRNGYAITSQTCVLRGLTN